MRIIPVSEINQMVEYRRAGYSIKATAQAFGHSQNYVAKIAPSTKEETKIQRSAGMKVYWAKRKAMKDVRLAMLKPELDRIDRKIAELKQAKIALLKSVG